MQRKAKLQKSCRNKFSNMKLQRAEKRKRQEEPGSPQRSKFTRACFGATTSKPEKSCFFCGSSSETLHEASTFNIDTRVRDCAHQLQDKVLIAKLSAVGDMISQEAVYHAKCLVELYNKAERSKETTIIENEKRIQGIALAQVVAYIEETRADTKGSAPTVFRLAEVTDMYSSCLAQLGVEVSDRVHFTDLKERLLANVPGLQANKKGRDIFLAFNDEVATALQKACERDFDNEAMTLLKATRIIRRDMLETKSKFNGTFDNSCQQESVPESLKTLIGMILGGTDFKTQSTAMTEAQTTLSISQLILFNATKRRRDSGTTRASNYHSRDREPPLPIYLGVMTHAETRKRTLVDMLYSLGLSISYDRVLELSTDKGNSVCERFESEGVVCPPKLLKGVFTTAAIENQPSKTKRLARLPDSYTAVRPVILPRSEPDVPPLQGSFARICPGIEEAFSFECKWLQNVRDELNKEISQNILQISWAAFHANQLLPNRQKSVG